MNSISKKAMKETTNECNEKLCLSNSITSIWVVKTEIDKWLAVDKSKSILRIKGKHTIIYQGFIYWN